MKHYIVDSNSGTILDIEGCYIVEAVFVDDELSDNEISDIAILHGTKIEMERGQ